jgi:hypothetical protein
MKPSRPFFIYLRFQLLSVSPWSCSSTAQLTSFQQFNLSFFIRYQTPFGNSLFVGTAKVRIFFTLSSLFLLFFFVFSFLLFVRRHKSKIKALNPLLLSFNNLSMYLPALLFHSCSSSEAGCKCKKDFNKPKQFVQLNCVTRLKP